MNYFNDTFLKACNNEETQYIPVWLMRQAGRYQKEYRELRKKYSIKDIYKNPELAYKITKLPVEQFNVDAAIIFSDLLTPLEPMGFEFDYKEKEGPVFQNPVKNKNDIEKIKDLDPDKDLEFTAQTLTILKKELNVPCIGFVGAPFTLASYIIEGASSKNFVKTKSIMYNYPELWHKIMSKLVKNIAKYAVFQVKSGAMAIQIFDSWIACLDNYDFKNFVLNYTFEMIDIIKKNVKIPVIYFGLNSNHILKKIAKSKVDVLSVDWRNDLLKTINKFKNHAIQGNLDPVALFANEKLLITKIKNIINEVMKSDKEGNGFIFNLGHGILPNTSVENVKKLVSFVHEYSKNFKKITTN